jgi:AhpD family alkylhydroperoxidase
MNTFMIHTPDSAPVESKHHLQNAQNLRGRVPNLYGVLAEAPIAIEAYLTFADLMLRSSFTPTERHVVWFALNAYHDCHYCMAAHTLLAKSEKVSEAVIESARAVQSYEDPKLEALRVFTLSLADSRGRVSPEEIETFLSAGYTRQNVLEIIVAISHKVLSNYTNHIAHTPVDGTFARFVWTRPSSNAA